MLVDPEVFLKWQSRRQHRDRQVRGDGRLRKPDERSRCGQCRRPPVLISPRDSGGDSMMNRRGAQGFTLIELMVVVAIVGIIAAIAMPSYTEQVHKSRRADAVRALGQLQLNLERWRAENPCYGESAVGSCPTF